jgi:hypothetical protein
MSFQLRFEESLNLCGQPPRFFIAITFAIPLVFSSCLHDVLVVHESDLLDDACGAGNEIGTRLENGGCCTCMGEPVVERRQFKDVTAREMKVTVVV